jgi:hypothetical protein
MQGAKRRAVTQRGPQGRSRDSRAARSAAVTQRGPQGRSRDSRAARRAAVTQRDPSNAAAPKAPGREGPSRPDASTQRRTGPYRYPSGSTGFPLTRTSKCRCGPNE